MSFLFGKKQSTKPSYTGLQLQTSSSTQPITLLWGCNRISMNLIWYGDFKANKKKQKAGKGMGGSSTYYTYSTSFQGGLCEGPIDGVGVVYKDDEKTTLSALGMTLFTGTYPQAPWGYLTSKHPDAALNYEGVSYIAIANYDLGQQASLGNHSFEVRGLEYGTCVNGHDADCAVIVKAFLTDEQFGAGFGLSRLDQEQLFSTGSAGTTGDSSYQTYCTAMGFGLSPALGDQTNAGDVLARWAMLTNSAVVWNGYQLKLVPYVREEVEGNDVKYIPPQLDEPAYVLTMADFLEDPKVDRVDQSECPNIVILKINNKDNEYNELPVEFRDQSLIDLFGERKGNTIDAAEVTDPEMAAEMVGLVAARSCYTRNTYKLRLGQEYVLIEPMDVLGIVNASGVYSTVQVKTVEENEDNEFQIEAEEIGNGVSSRGGFTNPGTATPVIKNTGVIASPVNPPIIFEPAASLTAGVAQVWAAVSGGDGTSADPNWGGAVVYISTDNVTFQAVGEVDSPARMGKTTDAIAAPTGSYPEAVTFGVDLRMSEGELQAVTVEEAETYVSLAYVGGELLSYTGATLTGTNQYDLDDIYRSLYNSTGSSHVSGVDFARLDENIFKFDLPADYIGKTLYLKFQSFNIWNSGYQPLEDCDVYTYEPDGNGYAIAPPTSVGLAFTATTQTDGTNIIKGTITIGASTGPYLDHYDVQITTDDGVTWQDISAISAGGTKTFFEPATPSTDYQARSRAVSSAVGGIPSDWVVSTEVNSGAIGGTAPDAPTGLTATGGVLSNSLGWTAPAGGSFVQGYKVYAIEDPSGIIDDAALVGTVYGSSNLSFVHTGLGPSEEWRYWVFSFNLAGNSSTSDGPENATTESSGGGGGSLDVQYDSTTVVNPATTLDFQGAGVTVVDEGSGVASVTIPGGGAPDWLIDDVGTGSSQDILIPSYPSTEYKIFVFVDGLRFNTTQYTVAGNTVTLTADTDAVIEILGWDASAPLGYTTWRFYNVANNGGVLTGFGDIYLYDGATNLNPEATVTTESAYAGVYVAAWGVDSNPTTWCLSNFTNSGWWLQWVFPSVKQPTSFMIDRGTTDTAGYLPKDFILQYYDDALSSWVDAVTVTGETGWGVNEQRTFTVP